MECFFGVWRVFWGLGRVFSKVLHFGQDVLHFCYMFFVIFSEKMHFFLGRKAPVVIVRYFTGIFCWSPGGFAARYALFSGIFDLNFKKMGLLH